MIPSVGGLRKSLIHVFSDVDDGSKATGDRWRRDDWRHCILMAKWCAAKGGRCRVAVVLFSLRNGRKLMAVAGGVLMADRGAMKVDPSAMIVDRGVLAVERWNLLPSE